MALFVNRIPSVQIVICLVSSDQLQCYNTSILQVDEGLNEIFQMTKTIFISFRDTKEKNLVNLISIKHFLSLSYSWIYFRTKHSCNLQTI